MTTKVQIAFTGDLVLMRFMRVDRRSGEQLAAEVTMSLEQAADVGALLVRTAKIAGPTSKAPDPASSAGA